MKAVRKDVFETNSSSTHSVSLAYYTEDELQEGKFPDCTFRIVSPLYKTMFLRGLMNYHSTNNGHYNEKTDTTEYDEPTGALLRFYDGCKTLLSSQIGIPKEKIDDYLEKEFWSRFSDQQVDPHPDEATCIQEGNIGIFKADCGPKLTCEAFFEEGCLDSCYCGFDSMLALSIKLPLYGEDPLTPEEFFSPRYAFVLCEKYAGCLPINSNKEL